VSADHLETAAFLVELMAAPLLTLKVRRPSGEIQDLKYLWEDGEKT